MKSLLAEIPTELFILWGVCLVVWLAPESLADDPLRWSLGFIAKFSLALVVVSLLGIGRESSRNPYLDASAYFGLALASVWVMDVGWTLAVQLATTSK